jgi:hypothetical protein
MKLIVIDKGDPQVGIKEAQYEVDSPFGNPDTGELYTTSKEETDYFKNEIINLYKNFANGRVIALYDFEFKKMED